jgi:AraC family transcriptional regulator
MIDAPLHSLMWFVPRASLNALADEISVPFIDELRFDPTVGMADETIRHLSASVLPALKAPHQINRLFFDHISMALAAHVAHAYGGMQIEPRTPKGGLASWQVRRAKEMLVSDLTGATPLGDIATACGLSPGHFARAFRRSTGLAPHAWLLNARVDRAMALLLQPELALSDIALACGFADHSHFSRVFARHTGQSPRAWRRLSIR